MTTQVIYVAGVGHSGSTVLDITLGNHEQVKSVGELHKLHRSGWRTAENRRCSCGSAVHECSLWSAVREGWERRVGGDRLDDYVALQNRYESSYRCWPRLIRDSRRRTPAFERYVDMTVALYDAISEATGLPAVADSSKKPSRPFALSHTDRIDLKVIHLVRDGRGVVWSQMKPRRKNVEGGIPEDHRAAPSWHTASRWAFRNFECDRLARRLGESRLMRLTYEHFTHEPETALNEIGQFVGRDFSTLARRVAAGDELSVEHLVAGNALRMGGGIVLRPVSDWTDKLPPRDRRIFWLLAGRQARRYGYQKL